MKKSFDLLCYAAVCTLLLSAASCGGGRSKPSPISRVSFTADADCTGHYDYTHTDTLYDEYCEDEREADDVAVIPYTEECGVKIVAVRVNGIPMDMILDTGCSGTLISLAEANYLFEKGLLTDDDFLGTSESVIADGSVVENMVVMLRRVEIGGAIYCDDVVATVSPSVEAPLLMGNEILDRVKSFTVDNVGKNIILNLY
ncbi:MAG: retroviral-like aspartic protease family protein [Alistipes sp.]|nr:retroviral-like aspartic protease family protein [Alistipes sp.]